MTLTDHRDSMVVDDTLFHSLCCNVELCIEIIDVVTPQHPRGDAVRGP